MGLYIFNTLGRKLEEFKTSHDEVKMYTCGPTVYHFAHIGNLRTYINEDILKRVLIFNGYKVKHVMNLTDVGHLTSDADEGEDKMEKGAAREGITAWDVAARYTEAFLQDMQGLNVLMPDILCKATDHIPEQIDMVKKLEEKGFTYQIADGIYYDTTKFPKYGELSGQKLEELQAGARVEMTEGKKHVCDFALWKFSPADKKRDMEWDSPWGKGFPGWHIECSAMSLKYLGDELDIHCGGVDHIKIHHTNEIAQIEPLIGKKWCNFWVHYEFLNDQDGKMSKSKGEFLTLEVLKERGIDPIVYRYFVVSAHYRTQQNLSFEALEAAKNAYRNLTSRIDDLREEVGDSSGLAATDVADLHVIRDKMKNIINNDINTPEILAYLFEILKDNMLTPLAKLEAVKNFDALLGLRLNEIRVKEPIPDTIVMLAEARKDAKKIGDFAKADELRAQIKAAGFEIKDNADGYKLTKI